MNISGFCLALAGALLLSMPATGALAQDAAKKAPQVFNATGTGKSSTTAPVFVKKAPSSQPSQGLVGGVLQTKKSYGMKSVNVPSSPENVRKAHEQFKIDSAKQQALNKQIRDERYAQFKKQFEETKARETAISNQKKAQRLATAEETAPGTPGERAPYGMTPAQTATDPYAGSNVVFTGKKKDGDEKPARLFNTR